MNMKPVGQSPGSRHLSQLKMVGVAIPARDEHNDIEGALHAVSNAIEDPGLAGARRVIVVANDDSSDDTGNLARRALGSRGEVVDGSFGSAAEGRKVALDRLIEMAEGLRPEHVWLATTDADSRVPPSWLVGQLRWWREGADAVAGMVTPIWDLAPEHWRLREEYEAMMETLGIGPGHPHVYGANLGFTAAAYLAGGRVPSVPSGEDHALFDAFRATGARVLSVADDPVKTSARLVGRAPGGFAALLSRMSTGLPTDS